MEWKYATLLSSVNGHFLRSTRVQCRPQEDHGGSWVYFDLLFYDLFTQTVSLALRGNRIIISVPMKNTEIMKGISQ